MSKWDFRPELLSAYRGTGHELIPLNAPDAIDQRGRPVGKAPRFSGWRTDPRLSVDEAVAHMRGGGNVGVRLRDADLVVDVDPRNFLEGDDPLARLEEDIGFSFRDSCPSVVTGSGGWHFYLRKPADASVRDSLEAYQGVEFKTHGRQVVAPGSVHPETKRHYSWHEDDGLEVPLKAAPLAPPFLMELVRRPGRTAAVDAGSRTPEELSRMLEGLDATQFEDYDRWLTLMMACHHATAGEGRTEFIEWSTTDAKYAGDGWVIGRKWDGLHADSGGRRVTEKTLFKELVEAGRKDLLPQEPRPEAKDDFAEFQGDEDLSHLPDGDPSVGPLEALNAKGYCAVNDRGQFRIYRLRPDYEDPGKRTFWETYKKGDFLDILSNVRIETEDGKVKRVAQEWLEWSGRTSYDGVVFDPGRKIPQKERILNLWTDWAVQPKKGDWSLMKRLLLEGLCAGDQASYEYCLSWAAFMVQHPDRQAEVAVIFRGQKGTGKGTWGKALAKLAGRHGLHISSQHHFTNHFNAHLRDCIFLFADEAMWAGDKRAEGELKRLITEPTLLFEAKGKDAVTGRNLLHVMMASNEDWVVPASLEDERRFAVFEVDPVFRGNRAFFDALYRQLGEQGGLQAMLWDLKARDLGDFHPRSSIPATSALARQKLASLDFMDAWWYDCLMRGTLGQAAQPISGGGWDAEGTAMACFLAHDVCRSFEDHARQMGDRRAGARALQSKVGEWLGRRVPTLRKRRVRVPEHRTDVEAFSDGRATGYWLPSLAECRAFFEAQLGTALDWQAMQGEEDDDGVLDVDPVLG